MTDLAVGSMLRLGQFRIDGVIARGGFGTAYLASDRTRSKQVAIKEFFPNEPPCTRRPDGRVMPSRGGQAAFDLWRADVMREAERLADIAVPGVVEVLDHFQENGTSYLVMAYVDGAPLADLMQKRWSELRVRKFVTRMVQILDAVHSRGIVHRDLGPRNVLLDADECPTIIDFGLARPLAASASRLVGTPGYAAPEQVGAVVAGITPATDVYSLAVLVGQLLTGVAPRAGEPLGPLVGVNPAIAAALEHAVVTEPRARPQSMKRFLDEFQGRARPPGVAHPARTEPVSGRFISTVPGALRRPMPPERPSPT